MNYRLQFVIVLAVGLLLLVGCAASTASRTSSGQPAILASAISSQAQEVHVTISDSRIDADHSTFYAGIPYHFVVTNTGQATYQFVMGRRGWDYGHMMGRGEWDYNHMPMGWQHRMTSYWSSQIAPGTTTTFDYTLSLPRFRRVSRDLR